MASALELNWHMLVRPSSPGPAATACCCCAWSWRSCLMHGQRCCAMLHGGLRAGPAQCLPAWPAGGGPLAVPHRLRLPRCSPSLPPAPEARLGQRGAAGVCGDAHQRGAYHSCGAVSFLLISCVLLSELPCARSGPLEVAGSGCRLWLWLWLMLGATQAGAQGAGETCSACGMMYCPRGVPHAMPLCLAALCCPTRGHGARPACWAASSAQPTQSQARAAAAGSAARAEPRAPRVPPAALAGPRSVA